MDLGFDFSLDAGFPTANESTSKRGAFGTTAGAAGSNNRKRKRGQDGSGEMDGGGDVAIGERDYLAPGAAHTTASAAAAVAAAAKKKKSGGFQAIGLSSSVLGGILKMGYKVPTPIQRKALPIALSGRDLVAMARTGSGKTAAFLIPLLERLKTHSTKIGARAVVLSPTRELALQTLKFVKGMGKYTDLRFCPLIGGASMEGQFSALADNPDVIVATPGRLMHHLLEVPGFNLRNVEYVVFDEADRLFEMGFADQITEIMSKIPEQRQTLLFSATLPKVLVQFAKAGLREPELLRLDIETKVSENLRMAFLNVRKEEKAAALLWVLRNVIPDEQQAIVFVSTRHHTELITTLLQRCGLAAESIYGAMDQTARIGNLSKFRARKTRFLVVTDVAARGIDIPLLDNVVNYDFPDKPKLFVHRAGRVARQGRTGTAFSLVSASDVPYMLDLHLFLGRAPSNIYTAPFVALTADDALVAATFGSSGSSTGKKKTTSGSSSSLPAELPGSGGKDTVGAAAAVEAEEAEDDSNDEGAAAAAAATYGNGHKRKKRDGAFGIHQGGLTERRVKSLMQLQFGKSTSAGSSGGSSSSGSKNQSSLLSATNHVPEGGYTLQTMRPTDCHYGQVPRSSMETDIETVRQLLDSDVELVAFNKSATNAMQLYQKTRGEASKQSVARAHTLPHDRVHPLLLQYGPANDSTLRGFMATLQSFRPTQTIMELEAGRAVRSAVAAKILEKKKFHASALAPRVGAVSLAAAATSAARGNIDLSGFGSALRLHLEAAKSSGSAEAALDSLELEQKNQAAIDAAEEEGNVYGAGAARYAATEAGTSDDEDGSGGFDDTDDDSGSVDSDDDDGDEVRPAKRAAVSSTSASSSVPMSDATRAFLKHIGKHHSSNSHPSAADAAVSSRRNEDNEIDDDGMTIFSVVRAAKSKKRMSAKERKLAAKGLPSASSTSKLLAAHGVSITSSSQGGSGPATSLATMPRAMRKQLLREGKLDAATAFRDVVAYVPHLPASEAAAEAGYSARGTLASINGHGSASSTADTAAGAADMEGLVRYDESTLDLMGDEREDIAKAHKVRYWDAKKKRYLLVDSNEVRHGMRRKPTIRNEAGVLVERTGSGKNKNGEHEYGETYRKWVRSTRKQIEAGGEEDEGSGRRGRYGAYSENADDAGENTFRDAAGGRNRQTNTGAAGGGGVGGVYRASINSARATGGHGVVTFSMRDDDRDDDKNDRSGGGGGRDSGGDSRGRERGHGGKTSRSGSNGGADGRPNNSKRARHGDYNHRQDGDDGSRDVRGGGGSGGSGAPSKAKKKGGDSDGSRGQHVRDQLRSVGQIQKERLRKAKSQGKLDKYADSGSKKSAGKSGKKPGFGGGSKGGPPQRHGAPSRSRVVGRGPPGKFSGSSKGGKFGGSGKDGKFGGGGKGGKRR